MALENFLTSWDLNKEKWAIWDLSMDFNGDILELITRICMQIMRAKVLIS